MSTKVNDKSAAVTAMEEDWDKVDALIGGTKTMRAAGERWLPKFPGESQKSWDYRVKTSTLYNAMGRTVKNMAAKTPSTKCSGTASSTRTWSGRTCRAASA